MHAARRADCSSTSAAFPRAWETAYLFARPAGGAVRSGVNAEAARTARALWLPATLLVWSVLWLLAHAPALHAQTIAAGGDHTCAFTPAGGTVCWGANDNGELGDNTTIDRSTPNNVSGLPFGSIALAAGYSHSCAVTSVGAAMCWGLNLNSQLGDGTAIQRLLPVTVSGLSSGVTKVAGGRSHSCALGSGGGVQCWGKNNNGQLGTGTAPTADQATPAGVSGLGSGVIAIGAGFDHNCAVTGAGAVKCWGANFGAQLGDPAANVIFEAAPIQVVGLTSGFIAVAAGSDHSCALSSGGAMKCWGDNASGAIGNGTLTLVIDSPSDVVGLSSGVTAITAGQFHSCALVTGGGVKCWGKNLDGQVGDGTTTQRNAPVTVIASGATAIAAGANHTCALFGSGASSCWGANVNGQMGYGAFGGPSYVPVSSAYPSATTTLLASGLNPSVFGDNVTFTATVTGGVNGTAVAFQNGGANIGGCVSQPLAAGTASCTTGGLGGGTHSIAAIYPGTAATLASSSGALSQVVNRADQTITFDALANKQDIDPPFTVTASASSAGPVTFSSITTLVCTVSSNTVTIVSMASGTCTIAANQGGSTNFNAAPQVTQSFTVLSSGPALALSAVVSRKVHGGAGTFVVAINPATLIGGLIDVEPRAIGTGHTIVFSFNNSITSTGTVTSLDAASAPIGTVSAVISGNDVIVTLTAIPDNRRAKITLTGVNGTAVVASASIGFLIGDQNNSRSITGTDIGVVRGRSGQAVTAVNFKSDLNASGTLTGTDVSIVRPRSGLVIPP